MNRMTQPVSGRAARTRKRIQQALIDVAREKGIGHVTVTDIALAAGINRKTFYVYYDSVEDLIRQTIQGLTEKYRPLLGRVQLTGLRFDAYRFFEGFHAVMSEDIDLYRAAYYAGLLPNLVDAIKAMFIETFMAQYAGLILPEDTGRYEIFAEFACAGLTASFSRWIMEQDADLHEYADTVSAITLAAFRALNRIQRVHRQDMAEVEAFCAAVAAEPDAQPAPPGGWEAWARAGELFLRRLGGQIAAVMAVGDGESRLHPGETVSVLTWLAVRKDQRRRGIGTAMAREALRMAIARHHAGMEAVLSGPYAAAEALLTRSGLTCLDGVWRMAFHP